MSTTHHRELANIRRFDQLVRYLRDPMGWPIDRTDFEELTFEYTPEELGIDTKNAAKIQEIKRLRPLSPNQPWGIFFVRFEPKKLPVVALRRILSQVALKKRASANSTDRKAWAVDDLLFVSNYGEGNERQISFAHFSKTREGNDLPTLKVLGWDDRDTALHLDAVARELTEHLSWPENEADTETWRAQWRGAFKLRHREIITTSKELSLRLAQLACAIRNRINSALEIETESGPLTTLMTAFREALVHDLEPDGFADMYAQTIAYGLLSARIADPHKKTADDFAAHMRTNPFLRELMETFLRVGGRQGKAGGPGIDFDELGVSDVVELLDDANMEAVIRDFGDRNPEQDPVIHFYEHFLEVYDKRQKMQRGVFYTPQPVVSYIVRSIDEVLRSDFGLEDGLADTSTWGEMKERYPAVAIPPGVAPEHAFVQVLDPATGTGTFLVEVIRLVHETMSKKWKTQGHSSSKQRELWNDYVPNNLLPRLHGYELLMAPYAIAHLKIGLKLFETGYSFGSDERARVYLTNALEMPKDEQVRLDFLPALAHEVEAVNAVKRKQRFTAIIANPPYANYSANLATEARSLVNKYRSFAGAWIRERNQLQFERNLQDDFVKFVAIGEDEVMRTGLGVLGYITNATMLASKSLRGMREHLLREFNHLDELHLHGGVNEISEEARRDQNVFEIAQAVGIHLYSRSPEDGEAEVRFCELWGPRSAKYEYLSSNSCASTTWATVRPDPENCAFVPQQETDTYAHLRLPEVFEQFGAGIKTNRDKVAIAFSKAELIAAVREFAPHLVSVSCDGHVHPILYRPFDSRFIFYHEEVIASRSLPTMRHVLAGSNIGLIASSTWTTPARFSVGVSNLMVEMKTGTHDRGTTYFPLYRFESILNESPRRMHNLSPAFVEMWERCTGTKIPDGAEASHDETSRLEDVLHWIYGVSYSPSYRSRFRARLAQGFPIVLFPRGPNVFREVSRLGAELVDLHTMPLTGSDELTVRYEGPDSPEVGKIGWSDGTVWLDATQTKGRQGHRATRPGTIGFHGVPEDVWDFHVGGYQVCHKWLKDRRRRALSKDEIAHYQKVVSALKKTAGIMSEIDEAIEAHGGWPGAFQERQATTRKESQGELF